MLFFLIILFLPFLSVLFYSCSFPFIPFIPFRPFAFLLVPFHSSACRSDALLPSPVRRGKRSCRALPTLPWGTSVTSFAAGGALRAPTSGLQVLAAPAVRTAKRSCGALLMLPLVPSVRGGTRSRLGGASYFWPPSPRRPGCPNGGTLLRTPPAAPSRPLRQGRRPRSRPWGSSYFWPPTACLTSYAARFPRIFPDL